LSSDEEEEEEEEEDDDEPASRKRGVDSGVEEKKKKKQKLARQSFFDEEAEASDSEEEEEDEPYGSHRDPNDVVRKHYSVEDIEREQLDEEAREMIRQQDRRRQQAGGRFGAEDTDERSVADMAREIERRHTMQRRTVDRNILDRGTGEIGSGGDETFGGPSYSAVSQQSLVPSVSDPSLWMFSCQTGKEEELVYQIMNKCIAYAAQGKPLGITSAVAAQSKGKIYVESYSEPAVIEAMQGIRNLMQYSMRLVPINDMTTVMTVVPKKKPGMRFSLHIACL
jgi:transcription elongation factor SPT5